MRSRRRNRWHDFLMDQYLCAAHAWWREAEQVTMLYETELAEFKLERPQPQLKMFMLALSPIYWNGVPA